MEKKLQDRGVVSYQTCFEVVDQVVTLGPHRMRYKFMHPHHKHIFVMRSIEDHNFAFARGTSVSSPQKIVGGLLLARLLETEDEGPLRVHPAKNVANNAVFAGSVECLQDHKKGLVAVRIEQVLQLVHACDVFLNLG